MNRSASFRMTSISAGIVALTGLGFVVETAGAAPLTDLPPTITVHYADLDVSKPAGAQVLYRRIQAAAKIVCGSSGNSPSARAAQLRRVCYKQAVANAVAQVKQRELLALK